MKYCSTIAAESQNIDKPLQACFRWSDVQVFQHIDIEDYDYLLEQDQLLSEKAKKTVFEGWEEGKITFAPTYKYQPGQTG